MGNIGPTFIAIVGGVITLAMIAVLVSKQANTSGVITGSGTALAGVLSAAVGPVMGGSGLGGASTNTVGQPG